MESLPTEILLYISEHVSSLQDLLALRNTNRRLRDLVDRSCAQLAFQLARTHFDAFDDALLAVRLKRIPFESSCHYIDQQNTYSFLPSKDFLQAVLDGRPVPTDCPSIPSRSWVEECAAVLDLYLLALAWHSTRVDGPNGSNRFLAGIDIPQNMGSLAPQYLRAYLRSFYRVCIFTSLFGPRVVAEPVRDAVEKFGKSRPEEDYESYKVEEEVIHEIRRFPIYGERNSPSLKNAYSIFAGFFEWLYSQPEPGNKIFRETPRSREPRPPQQLIFSREEQELVALLQFWKVLNYLSDRDTGEELSDHDHVKPVFNPLIDELPELVYRSRLRISPWSKAQKIIDHWADSSDICSVVLQHQYHASAPLAICEATGDFDDPISTRVLQTEISNKFNMRFDPLCAFYTKGDCDFGLLDPRSEVEDA